LFENQQSTKDTTQQEYHDYATQKNFEQARREAAMA
jgi:hypothetical protein